MTDSFREIAVLDAHIHYGHPSFLPGLIEILDRNHIAKCSVVCTPHTSRLSLVPDALHLKAHYPQRVYVFGGLDISALFVDPAHCGEIFAGYLDSMVRMGCDGVKMIEGKPDMRKTLPIPDFDSPAYAPYWAKLEQMGLPLLFHVNDPEEFWDPARVPGWAREQGWFWGDGSYINNEEQYRQVLAVLRRHPGLKVIFAHFFFLSNQLERLAGYLDEFPNMHVDLTPGIEMYTNFSCAPQRARDFFLKYQERILFGTDIGAPALLASATHIDPADSAIRAGVVRSFLEREGSFTLEAQQDFALGKFAGPFQGINLPVEALEKIYHGNFERLAGTRPRALDPAAIVQECRRLAAVIPVMGAAQPGERADASIAEMVAEYFQGSGT